MKLIEVYNGNLFECQMLQHLLENEGIESFLKDEIIGTRSAVWSPGSGVRLMISDEVVEQARKIVEEFESNR
ncbi:MAG: DUF2007 domain-containing protein [Paludibacter sp.]|nr:MAG: DUF2007 domain-containing protein [Paludibacter sp.]